MPRPTRRPRDPRPSPVRARRARVRTLAAVLLLAVLAAAAAQGPGIQEILRDPEGRYSVALPETWTQERSDGVLTLRDPDGAIAAHVRVEAGEDAEAAVVTAVAAQLDRDDLEVANVVRPPVGPPLDEVVNVVFQTPRARLLVGVGYRVADTVYVLVLDADTDAYARRQAQVGIVFSSFDLTETQASSLADATPRAFDASDGADLAQAVPRMMAMAGVPGAVMAVVQGGEVVYLEAFGVRTQGTDDPMRTDTAMMIGSSGKSLTTLMMATLVDDGSMRWDTPVVELLPTFAVADPQITRTLTIRDMVCACTGVPRRDLELLFNGDTLGAEGVVASLADFPFFTPVGEAFQYSNQMVAAGGYIASLADGANPYGLLPSYAEDLQRRVLGPIGMRDTTLSFRQVAARGTAATPHGQHLLEGLIPVPVEQERFVTPLAPAGGHWSTAPDMARYLQTLLAGGVAPDGRRVVSAENLAVVLQPQVQISAAAAYALGWIVTDFRGVRLIQHGGNTNGFTSGLTFLPDAGIGVVVLTNGRATNTFNEAVIERVLRRLYGLSVEEAERDYAFTLEVTEQGLDRARAALRGEVDPVAVAAHLGTYRNPALGDLRLAWEDGRLMMDAGEFALELRRRVDPADGSIGYMTVSPPLMGLVLELTEDAAGKPALEAWVPPDRYRFTRVGHAAAPQPR